MLIGRIANKLALLVSLLLRLKVGGHRTLLRTCCYAVLSQEEVEVEVAIGCISNNNPIWLIKENLARFSPIHNKT